MTIGDMDKLLSSILPRDTLALDPPSPADWDRVQQAFQCQFGDDYRHFVTLMSKYAFPGDIFNISGSRTNGDDHVSLVYDLEMQNGRWQKHMIPFYGIGNGDYFCLNRDECPSSPVYYWYHDGESAEIVSPSFEAWIRKLPEFLGR